MLRTDFTEKRRHARQTPSCPARDKGRRTARAPGAPGPARARREVTAAALARGPAGSPREPPVARALSSASGLSPARRDMGGGGEASGGPRSAGTSSLQQLGQPACDATMSPPINDAHVLEASAPTGSSRRQGTPAAPSPRRAPAVPPWPGPGCSRRAARTVRPRRTRSSTGRPHSGRNTQLGCCPPGKDAVPDQRPRRPPSAEPQNLSCENPLAHKTAILQCGGSHRLFQC